MLLHVHRDRTDCISRDGEPRTHTPSTAFRHSPPNSARFSYATEGAFFISAQLSMQRRGQRPLKGSCTNRTVEAT